jgi:hypothetical protein
MMASANHPFACALFVCLASTGVARAQPFHMEDTLRGATTGNQVGGSLGPDGWTVTDRADRIWWALPRLESGSIELTVANVTLANLNANDHEIFAMYEAGYGIVEPIRYNPDFRNNHYKCLIRLYGTAEAGREGLQKLMWGMCPSGDPGYDACGCGDFFEEPFGGDGTWDGSPQRFRVEWGAGTTRLLRNGVEVVLVDWSGSGLVFGPSELHFSLGTPRPLEVGTASMPVGAVFSDVVVDGVEGPLASCEGPVITDAGVDGGGPDGGATDGGAIGVDASSGVDASIDGGGVARDGGRGSGVSGDCGCRVSSRTEPSPLSVLALFGVVVLRSARRGGWRIG